MLRVSVCYVAGPVLCVGSLGVVSVRHARYPYVRADSSVRLLYGILRIRTSFVRLFVS